MRICAAAKHTGSSLMIFAVCAVTAAAPLRIMPVGNSITEGSDGSATYRYFLWHNLKDLGVDADFVGSKHGVKDNGRPLYTDFDQDHEGHWGWRADSIQLHIGAWARQTRPDVVLMHLGTNDWFADEKAGVGAYVNNTLGDYSAIIDSLRSAYPRVTVFVGQLIPAYYGAPIDSLNARIPAFAQKKTTPASRVITVDIHSSVRMAADGDYVDGLHPNDRGQRKMADAWTTALVEYLTINAPPRIQPSSGSFVDSVTVAMTSYARGSTIRYTLDGSAPTSKSPAYSAPLHFQANRVVAVAARSFAPGSAIGSPVTRAKVAVAYDTAAPLMSYIAASQRGRILLGFSEPCDTASPARSPSNYAVSGGVRVDSVSIAASGSSVVLHTGPMKSGATYTVTVRKLTDRSLRRNLLATSQSQAFTPIATGRVVQEIWTSIPGEKVVDLTSHARYAQRPDRGDTITALTSHSANLDVYGSRVRCLLSPPVSGEYTFWITADDAAELWLSSDSSAAGKRLIAAVPGWTAPGRWEKYPEQASSPVRLVKGQKYYCEVLHKEGIGGDHVGVAWKVPGGMREVIDGVFLADYR